MGRKESNQTNKTKKLYEYVWENPKSIRVDFFYLILLHFDFSIFCFSVVIMVQCYTMVMLVHQTVNSFMMVICGMIRDVLWDNLFLQYTNIKVEDQSEHSLRPVCTFDVPYLESFRQNFKILTSL